MLIKFAVTNFKGFKERIEFDLSKPRNYEFNTFAVKDGIIRDAIIYGPNGSGKSNIGLAIFDIINHLSQNRKESHFYFHPTYGSRSDLLMLFEYTFIFDGQIVEYSYKKNILCALIEEKLIVDSKTVFERGSGLSIDSNSFPMTAEARESLLKSSNSVSIVNYLLATYPLSSDHYLNKLKRFVDSMLWFRCLESRGFMGLQPNSPNTSIDEFIISNNLVDDFRDFLWEISEQRFVFKKHEPTEKILICLIDGSEIAYGGIQSTGTSSLMLLYYWLKNINNVALLFIDEFDAFYHFRLSAAVCKRLFQLPCQVILTSHNTYLMSNEILRPDCNFIIENNRINALCDCTDKELRWGHNIEKLFRGGAFEQ